MISFKDLLHISVRQVFRQRKRSFGIILAIALGTAGLIVILSVGDEVKKNLNRDLDLLGGATLLKVSFKDEQIPGVRPKSFNDDILDDLRTLSGVRYVSRAAERTLDVYLFDQGKQYYIPTVGVDEWYWSANNLTSVRGRLFGREESHSQAQVCVLGRALARSLYGTGSVLGKYLPIKNDLYRVVGVVDGLLIGPRKNYAFIPRTTLVARAGDKYRPDRLAIQCKTWDDVEPVVAAIPEIVGRNQDPSYLYLDVGWDQLKRIISIVWWVELFVYLAIGATLVLGGFGIWNGMMTSVTARTREIGLKKAMGAEPSDIMGQFLCESLCLSLLAALLGVTLGYIVVEVTSYYLGSTPSRQIMMTYSGISIAFSGFLGFVAGFYPALKASKMDPVTAIRYE